MNHPAKLAALLIVFVVGEAFAADPPSRKPGLWSVEVAASQTFSQKTTTNSVYKICRSHAYDVWEEVQYKQRSFSLKGTPSPCKLVEDKLSGNVYSFSWRCNFGADAQGSETQTITMNEDGSVHEERRRLSSTIGGPRSSAEIRDEHYLGQCPSGLEAGDRIDPDGKITHLWPHTSKHGSGESN